MLPEADCIRLRHMLDATREARGYLQGRSREDLDRDTMLFRALGTLRCVIAPGFTAEVLSPHRDMAHYDTHPVNNASRTAQNPPKTYDPEPGRTPPLRMGNAMGRCVVWGYSWAQTRVRFASTGSAHWQLRGVNAPGVPEGKFFFVNDSSSFRRTVFSRRRTRAKPSSNCWTAVSIRRRLCSNSFISTLISELRDRLPRSSTYNRANFVPPGLVCAGRYVPPVPGAKSIFLPERAEPCQYLLTHRAAY